MARPERDRRGQVGTIRLLAWCIALWLGYDPIATAHLYVRRHDADGAAIAGVIFRPASRRWRYQPPDSLATFPSGR